jgi:putative transposase
MARGIERRAIFVDDVDRNDLLDRLREIVPDCGAALFAWTFMPNHVHFVIRSGHHPLSRLMKRINSGFATRFNLRHERVGYLFQNRFRSRLVTSDGDLQGLVRYVHLNGLRGGLVPDLDALETWRWSGHGALMGRRRPHEFEDVAGSLSLFDSHSGSARQCLRRWMADGLLTTCSGEDTETDEGEVLRTSAPSKSITSPDASDRDITSLVERTCRYYGASLRDLLRGSRAARVSRARAVICHIAVSHWRMPVDTVATVVGVSSAAVCQSLDRGEQLATDDWDRIPLPARTVT